MENYSPTCIGAAVTHMSGAAATAMRTPPPPPTAAAVVHCWCSALTLRQGAKTSGVPLTFSNRQPERQRWALSSEGRIRHKYEKYAEKGKPEKLEKAMEKQRAKLQKATDKGKPQEYLMYKAEKIEFTQKMWTLAHLVANMKRAGFLPQC